MNRLIAGMRLRVAKKKGVNTMPDCNKCIWSTRNGGCVSWKCDFVSHDDARKMIEKEREEGEYDERFD